MSLYCLRRRLRKAMQGSTPNNHATIAVHKCTLYSSEFVLIPTSRSMDFVGTLLRIYLQLYISKVWRFTPCTLFATMTDPKKLIFSYFPPSCYLFIEFSSPLPPQLSERTLSSMNKSTIGQRKESRCIAHNTHGIVFRSGCPKKASFFRKTEAQSVKQTRERWYVNST